MNVIRKYQYVAKIGYLNFLYAIALNKQKA